MDKNIIERINLLGCSGKMVAKNFVFGVGLGNFIPELVKIGCAQKGMWLLQPVHNLFLLVFSETGIIGLILVTLFLLKVLKIILTKKTKAFYLELC
jgi:O-antigen ligase